MAGGHFSEEVARFLEQNSCRDMRLLLVARFSRNCEFQASLRLRCDYRYDDPDAPLKKNYGVCKP